PIPGGEAGNGICGGFVFAALDLFLHNPRLAPPLQSLRPGVDTPLFAYLCNRLMDSLGRSRLFDTGRKVAEWIQSPSHDTVVGSAVGIHGLAFRMIAAGGEWQRVKADI